jgi:APA family basic amino acid/polyamine antiporter
MLGGRPTLSAVFGDRLNRQKGERVAEEQLAFARKASGLVRGLSMWDAFGVGFMNQGLTPSIWVMMSLGLGVYLGGNLWLATIISCVLAGIGFPIVWGVLGGSMPRSGGEYIYNSRIIHPIVGIAESFGNAFVWIMWIYVLAPWIADPGFTMLAGFMGWPGLADFATTAGGMFLIATVTNIVAFGFVVFGIKIFARAQKIVMVFGIGGCALICVVLSLYSKQDFVTHWNGLASQYHSLDYNQFLAAVDKASGGIPSTWNLVDTLGVMVAGSWLFAYSYCITFIAGEVKRPDKTIMLSNLFAIIVPAVFMLWTSFALYHMIDFKFLSATAWLDNAGTDAIKGYAFPWSPHFVGLMAVVNHNKIILFIAALSFLAFDLWWVALSYLAFPRIIFAWGMDRMGPKWFTDVNPRWASPVKNHVLCFVLGEIGIALYTLWQNNPMQGLTVTGLEIFSVFGVTAFAALIFPYSKKAKGIWEASPYRTWKLLGIPVVSIGAVVDLIYLGILAWFFFVMPASRDFTINSLYFYIVIWALGIGWYFFWKQRSKAVGVDVSMTYGELPPE